MAPTQFKSIHMLWNEAGGAIDRVLMAPSGPSFEKTTLSGCRLLCKSASTTTSRQPRTSSAFRDEKSVDGLDDGFSAIIEFRNYRRAK